MRNVAILWVLLISALAHATEQHAAGQEKSTVCAACHGVKGISSNPLWPHLAGQHVPYLVKELHDFKNAKTRNAPTMTPMVANLSDQDMEDLAVYYASQPPAQGKTPNQYLSRGERLYRGGDDSAQITACIACHGPKGTGNAQAGFPVVSGQQAAYTVQQLQAFKDNTRQNDLNSIMRDISKRMSQEDMEAVAHYMQGLH